MTFDLLLCRGRDVECANRCAIGIYRMSDDKDLISNLLRDALVALSLPPAEQVRVTQPGCVSCELIEDFSHGYTCFTQSCSDQLSGPASQLLAGIDSKIESLSDDDCVCFDNTVLDRPLWSQLRKLAAKALAALGWDDHQLDAYTETEPGVWRRSNSNIVPQSDFD
ncbi:MAG: hypothetical protein IH991_16795 [Planctomycetes bacterium]|nr:hypothetical protein [Planctomycetota bacterium]